MRLNSFLSQLPENRWLCSANYYFKCTQIVKSSLQINAVKLNFKQNKFVYRMQHECEWQNDSSRKDNIYIFHRFIQTKSSELFDGRLSFNRSVATDEKSIVVYKATIGLLNQFVMINVLMTHKQYHKCCPVFSFARPHSTWLALVFLLHSHPFS